MRLRPPAATFATFELRGQQIERCVGPEPEVRQVRFGDERSVTTSKTANRDESRHHSARMPLAVERIAEAGRLAEAATREAAARRSASRSPLSFKLCFTMPFGDASSSVTDPRRPSRGVNQVSLPVVCFLPSFKAALGAYKRVFAIDDQIRSAETAHHTSAEKSIGGARSRAP